MSAMTLEEMKAQLGELLALRYGGAREVMTRTLDAEERVRYANDQELAAAISDLERRIQNASNSRITTVRLNGSKGL